MMSWFKMGGLTLLVGGLAAACTVTSGDDDDTSGAGGTSYTGGSGGATGGAATAGSGGVAGSAGTAGTAGTASTDQACFTCLGTSCTTDWPDCDATCRAQLSLFRECAYQRQHGLQADQNNVPETYGDAQQNVCIDVADGGDLNALSPAVSPLIGCASDVAGGAPCETSCFVF